MKQRSRVILAGERLEERSLLSAMPFPIPLSPGPRLAAEASSDSAALVAAPYAAVGANSIITTVAGNGQKSTLNQPQGVAADAKGNIYISDSWNDRVREVYKNGTIRTIRGQGAVYGFPVGLAVDSAGTVLYIAEQQNEVIHKINLITGAMTRYAGTGTGSGYQDDGHPATQTRLVLPTDLALDKNGDLYITEGGSISPHNRIRKVDHNTGRISTVVYEFGLNNIGAVAVDNSLNIFFTSSRGIMEADPSGKNLRVLANVDAESLAVDPTGNTVYFVQGQQVKSLQGGTITTIAGTGARGYKGDGGPASQAELNYPADIALDGKGSLFIADSWNHRIRAVKAPVVKRPAAPRLTARPISTSEVELSWKPVPGADSYEVWRRKPPNGGKILLDTLSGTRFVDDTLQPGEVRLYSVVARNSAGTASSAWVECGPARAELKGNTLVILGTDKADKILVGQTNGRISINNLRILYNGKLEKNVYSGLVGHITVDAGGGNDTIDLDTGKQPIYARANVDGGPGNDIIVGVQGGSNTILGGENDDRITGGNKDDRLFGDSGDDKLFGLDGNDELYGDSGNDWLEAGSEPEFADFGPNPSGTAKDWNAHQWSYNGATYDDVRQGSIGNCSFMAALSSVARRGADLDSRIRYRGNFMYEVQMYNFNGKPALQRIRFDGSGNQHDPTPAVTGEFWTILFRRAFLKLYGAIDNGIPLGKPLIALTSRRTTDREIAENDPAANASIFDEMERAILASRNVTTATGVAPLKSPKLVSRHAYTVLSVQRDSDGQPFSVRVRNPWGIDGGTVPSDNPNDGEITLSWVAFQQDMWEVAIN